MHFSLVTLYVSDMQKSLDFYNGLLGMPVLSRRTIEFGNELVFLGKEGDVSLELISTKDMVSYSGFSIGYNVDDLISVKKRLADGGYSIKREIKPGSDTVLCFFDGPNGEEIELISHAAR